MSDVFVVLAQAGGSSSGGGSMIAVVGPIAIFAVMIFFMFRAQRKQAKDRQSMINAIKAGDKIITVGGIFGEVVAVKDDSYTVKIAENVKVEMSKAGVATVEKRDSQNQKTSDSTKRTIQ